MLFVSSLSVSDFVLLPNVRVLGIVYGSVVHVERELELTGTSRVMKPASRSQSRVVGTALSRLQENATKMGATGVISVKVRHQSPEKGITEYALIGTAIAENNCQPQTKPFICNLSGQDYQLLISSGYRPVGVAFGLSVYSQRLHQTVQRKVNQRINTERSDFSVGLYRARKHAFDALHQEAAKLGAEGVLAITVSIEKKLYRQFGSSEGMVIQIAAMGTAVVSCSESDTKIGYAVPLTDGQDKTRLPKARIS